MHSRRFLPTAAALASLLAAGCGNSEQQNAAAPVFEHGVFISASDCEASGKATLDECGDAIDRAVTAHVRNSKLYASLVRCEAAEGQERCEKIGLDQYRARMQAFFVTFSKPPTALPLYPPATAVAGFKSPSNQQLSVLNETLHMSRAAIALANDNARLPGAAGDKTVLGADASAIR
jgi:hypothetical protein